jgi:hypothetical protein
MNLFQDLTSVILLVVGDVPVDSEMLAVTSSNSKICRLNLSGVGGAHRGEVCACVCRDKYTCVHVTVCICTV